MVDPKFDQPCITTGTLAVICARGLLGWCYLASRYAKFDGHKYYDETRGAMRCKIHRCGSLLVFGISFRAQQPQFQILTPLGDMWNIPTRLFAFEGNLVSFTKPFDNQRVKSTMFYPLLLTMCSMTRSLCFSCMPTSMSS